MDLCFLVPEEVEKEILQLRGITLERREVVIENVTSTRKRTTQNSPKYPENPSVVTKKHPQNQVVFKPSKLTFKMKAYDKAVQTKEKNKSSIIGDCHVNRIRKDKFKDSLDKLKFKNAHVYIIYFSGPNINKLNYYAVPALVDGKTQNCENDMSGSNDITKSTYSNVKESSKSRKTYQ